MKKLLLSLFGACCGASLFAAVGSTTPQGWYDDFAEAQKASEKSGRPILALFTGSDWCPYCVKLKKNVLDTPEFKEFAKDNVILFFADFPEEAKLPGGLRIQNEKLAKNYGIDGFPTTVIFAPNGNELGRIGGYAPDYLKRVSKFLEKR